MQKKILIPLVLILAISGVAVGASFLNPKNLPDTVEFPRIPMGDGTIGAVIGKILGTNDLGNYVGDGTVTNTLKLGWVTGTGYLKNTVCGSTEVWNGFDSNGKALCATKSTILAYYGQISEQTGTARIYRADGTSIPAAIGTVLKAGDIIKTDSASTITIAFVDTSILRLDADTTASLDISTISTEPNKQIASLILESGQVWGRILSPDTPTSTGYSLGSGDVVAWVRGTSIAIYKGAGIGTSPSWNTVKKKWTVIVPTPSAPTDIAVVHSRFPANASTGVALITMKDKTKKIMNPGEKVQYSTTAGVLNTLVSPSITSITDFYTSTPWIRENTKKDLDYMKTLSPTTVATRLGNAGTYTLMNTILPGEVGNSSPSLDAEKNALCTVAGQTFWNSLIGTRFTDKCVNSTINAFADFQGILAGGTPPSTVPLYIKTWQISDTILRNLSDVYPSTPTENDLKTTGYEIESTGEAITYTDPNFLSTLRSGTKITISLDGKVGSAFRTPTALGWTKAYILDTGNESWFAAKGVDCAGNQASGKIYLCKKDEVNIGVDITTNTDITLTLTKSVGSILIIWNTQINLKAYWYTWSSPYPSYNTPIGWVIKKVTIE